MRFLYEGGQPNLADKIFQMLAASNICIDNSTRILDFGCGSGSHVYEFRDLGFDAWGFDMYNYTKLRDADDAQYFRFQHADQVSYTGSLQVDEEFKIDYPDDTFDLVYSTSVMEHVKDHRAVMAEISRITKPGGISLHLYPPPWKIIEPHIYVPLAGAIQNYWWFYLWGLLGVRNEYQKSMTAKQVAENNLHYCDHGLGYISNGKMTQICQEYFGRTYMITSAWYGQGSGWRGLLMKFRTPRGFYERMHHCTLVCDQNKHQVV